MPLSNVVPPLARALEERGYAELTPVQTAVLQPEADGRDLLVSAQTGSGKTVAFGMAMAPTLLNGEERLGPAGEPLALVVAPTRELALQVHRELEWLYAGAGAKVVSCVGGMDPRTERRALASGAHIVVGTPGRLRDHLERGNMETGSMRAVILDEADEMLDLGFREDLEFILDATPSQRRTLLFSATMAKPIAALAKRYQRDAFRISTVRDSEQHVDIEYRAMRVAPNEKELATVNVLRFFEARGAMVFCSTREAVKQLTASLFERGFAVVALSGELSQNERSHALQALRDGRARVCVATDVAARGIDLPDLGLVIHYDLPTNREGLLHRSGRTGRAGRKGVCVLLVPHTRWRAADRMLGSANIRATWGGAPTAAEITAQDRERIMKDPAWAIEPVEEDLELGKVLLAEHGAEKIATAYARLAREGLPAPEELFEQPERFERRDRDGGQNGSERRERGPDRGGDRGQDRDFGRGRDAGPGGPRRDRDGEGGEGGIWFRMNVGRQQNADPRWLLPLICRRGHVTKREIGQIRILDRETKFEIHPESAPRFAQSIRREDTEDPSVRIEPVRTEIAPRPKPAHRPKKRPQV
ncbi:ATP-dependent RNA helicase DeaD [Faunimonas pinastri]|uniref:ATP-dependent RNA helicase DeaD n=1 Tax=Faunimonas pinastri TaxID=1855383 RepID=A0A1H9FV73_9HYPH|nr:DEAD/DEAH box helicase [Faunimonas pinastri]SEQ41754.1 ATP-dependent RNA helicase DeaD [Faunimonas pinastri]